MDKVIDCEKLTSSDSIRCEKKCTKVDIGCFTYILLKIKILETSLWKT